MKENLNPPHLVEKIRHKCSYCAKDFYWSDESRWYGNYKIMGTGRGSWEKENVIAKACEMDKFIKENPGVPVNLGARAHTCGFIYRPPGNIGPPLVLDATLSVKFAIGRNINVSSTDPQADLNEACKTFDSYPRLDG